MKLGRFFVTSVVLLGMALVVACDGHSAREKDGQDQHDKNQEKAKAKAASDAATTQEKTALVQEGNAKIIQAMSMQRELMNKFSLFIASEPKIYRNQILHTRDFAEKFNWRPLHKAERREIEGKLALYLQLLNRVLEIDSKNLISIDNREQILTSRDSAALFQKGLEDFERVYGQNYEPKEDAETPQQRPRSANLTKPPPAAKAAAVDEAEGDEEI
ncbi:MAG: hypothetical protein ACXVA9_12480 [Bdellovibrionales bacterium]